MKAILALIVILIGVESFSQEFSGKVVNVIDGNTFEIIDDYEEVSKFILKEVDCPELGQLMSNEAKLFSEDLILKKKVTVEVVGKDMWGNKLVIITLKNDKILHNELMKEGLAWASLKASSETSNFEASVKSGKIGIWIEPEPTPPWIFRRQQTMLQAKSR
jgi:micrococcal nuclease